MSVIKSFYITLVSILYTANCFSQSDNKNRESIYIKFDKNVGDTKFCSDSEINFYLNDKNIAKGNHKLKFVFNKKGIKKTVSFEKIKHKIISGKQAINKVDAYLKKQNRPIVAYYYNDYFKRIFLYEKISDIEGNLYEVKWDWYIE